MPLTTNEQQEYEFFKILEENKIITFSCMKLPEQITDKFGSGADAIISNMVRDGFISPPHGKPDFEYNSAGKNRYRILKSKANWDIVNIVAFWIIFGCTVITAADVISKGCAKKEPESKSLPSSLSIPSQQQIKDTQAQIVKPDTPTNPVRKK